jgi:adenylate cyclase
LGHEIERKFRLHGEGWRAEVTHTSQIRQGYVHLDGDTEVRVRVRDDRATITVKRGGPGLERREVEVDIGVIAAERLLAEACTGSVIEKRRHEIPIGELIVEVDEFAGRHEGLVLAEVEVPGSATPVPDRPWIGEEVTGDHRFYNASLSAMEGDGESD